MARIAAASEAGTRGVSDLKLKWKWKWKSRLSIDLSLSGSCGIGGRIVYRKNGALFSHDFFFLFSLSLHARLVNAGQVTKERRWWTTNTCGPVDLPPRHWGGEGSAVVLQMGAPPIDGNTAAHSVSVLLGGAATVLSVVLSACLAVALGRWLLGWRGERIDGSRRVVVISGAGSGLGRRTALKLAAEGDFVIGLDTDASALASLKKQLGDRVEVYTCDVRDAQAVAAVAEKVQICVDDVVNFAGVIRGGPLVEMPPSDVKLVFDVNVLGHLHVTQAFFPKMRTGQNAHHTRQGKIIIVGSEISAAWNSAAFNGPYSMSKFALEAFAAALRQEMLLLPGGPCVVIINPGAMKTPMLLNQLSGGANAFFELHANRAEGTRWRDSLLAGGEIAASYMERHGKNPDVVAKTVYRICHAFHPRDRYVIASSVEMRVSKYRRQWILDCAVRSIFARRSIS